MTASANRLGTALRTGSALTAMALATLFAVPAYAQTTTPSTTPGKPTSPTTSTTGDTTNQGDIVDQSGPQGTPANQANQPATGQPVAGPVSGGGEKEIVITGSILRNPFGTTPSPVTTVTTESLDRRGISTVQEGIQNLAANNGPALTNSFTANGAFAAGASAVSLRGLSTNSTLVLFDGLRAAYYPLADDGSRNFVDLNTIPDDIVERIDVLRDGASASYGADAIAGVVNIITKKQYNGIGGRVEAGISSRGDAQTYRASMTAGIGDLARNGVNAYISGFYYKSKALYNRDRPYPFNTDDLRQVCSPDGTACGPNNVLNGLNASNVFTAGTQTAANYIVRPYDLTNTTAGAARYSVLNPNCGPGTAYTLTAADLANPLNASAPTTVCQIDYTNAYGVINPDIKRFGLSGRVTANISDSIQGYAEMNFLQSQVSYTGFPPVVRGNANTGIYFPRFSTQSGAGAVAAGSGAIALPVYVCPSLFNTGAQATMVNGVPQFAGCTAANGTLNPNNPFAASGQVARLLGRDLNEVTYNETRTRAYRGALGITANLTDRINLDVGATAMHVDLRRKTDGYFYIQNFLNAVAAGTYNFRDPAATPQSVMDYITPENVTDATSDQYQFQAVVGAQTFELPGGALQLGAGGSVRYEAVDAPSANSDINGPTQRYFTLNAFGTVGSRYIYSAFAEARAPILDILEIDLAGRYDKYSSGQKAFSPKAGVIFKPIRQITLRGTWSKGFRIPSFGEANALPTTGFVTNTSAVFNDTYLAQYGCTVATFSSCPTYIRSGSYGQTTLASPNLDPEKSRSITIGGIFEPIRNVTLTVDYYNIKKTGAITQPSNAPALLAYYSGQPIPAGYNVIADAPDPNFPAARPRIAFVQSQLVNANTIKVSGLDFGVNARFNFGPNIKFNSQLDASYILKLATVFPDGTSERYDGTLGNFNLTAGSGTPKWHGTWENSLDFGRASVTGTVNYFGGYDLSAMDQGTGYKDCGLADAYSPVGCHVPRYITFDLGGRFKLTDNFTLYANVLNLFDKMPPIDEVTYGAHLYNPVQGGTGILGRYFKAGVRFNFAPPARVEEPMVVAPPPPPAPEAPATQTCADGSVILATATCPVPPPPPPPPAPAPERGL